MQRTTLNHHFSVGGYPVLHSGFVSSSGTVLPLARVILFEMRTKALKERLDVKLQPLSTEPFVNR